MKIHSKLKMTNEFQIFTGVGGKIGAGIRYMCWPGPDLWGGLTTGRASYTDIRGGMATGRALANMAWY